MNYFSHWFLKGPIPADALGGEYDFTLVGLSYLVAVLASYVALNLVGRLRAEPESLAKLYWLAGGAFTMGAGIWSMHFIGMIAFQMAMPMEYEFAWTFGSLLMAVFASALALFILQKEDYTTAQLALGGIIIGLAISTMHYMGMEGMKTHVNIHYIPSLFIISITIGIIAAEAALYLALESNRGSSDKQTRLKLVSALIMGVAICGMHYTGMAAAVFTPKTTHHMMLTQAIPSYYLAYFIAGVTILVISLALTVSNSYKKMVIAVSNEKNFLKTMLDNLEDGIIACDAQGRITVLNQSLQSQIGALKPNLKLDDLAEYFNLYAIEDGKLLSAAEQPLKRVLQGDTVHGLGLMMTFHNNIARDVIVYGQKIISVQGEILGAVVVIHDVTELKRTEKFKNEFVSTVSHELRTPLTSIRGSLGLLVSGVVGSFPDKANNLLEIANNNCERLLLLINDILDIEKIEAGKMAFDLKSYNLTDLISESIASNKMYADKYGVTVEFIPPDKPIAVYVDSGRLIQVLINLISNACKFSPKGEAVTVSVNTTQSSVRVQIADKGPGIPKEFQPRVFQKFSQADASNTRGKGGTGLGLNISKTIMERLNGVLNFISEPQKGTTFFFDLPILPAHHSTAAAEVDEAKKRVLICEDDQDQSDYLKALLESAGFAVDVASTVAQAKKLLAEHHYQTLLLDLILPDQDGIAFIRDIRGNNATRNLHIIVISIISQTGQALMNADALSVIDWFDKPIDFNKLLSSINYIKPKSKSKIPNILHVEDDEDLQLLIKEILADQAVVSTANTLRQAEQLLEQNDYDLVILDLALPDGNGIEILPLLSHYNVPVLVFSDMKLNEDYAKFVSQALLKSKSSPDSLIKTIKNLC